MKTSFDRIEKATKKNTKHLRLAGKTRKLPGATTQYIQIIFLHGESDSKKKKKSGHSQSRMALQQVASTKLSKNRLCSPCCSECANTPGLAKQPCREVRSSDSGARGGTFAGAGWGPRLHLQFTSTANLGLPEGIPQPTAAPL